MARELPIRQIRLNVEQFCAQRMLTAEHAFAMPPRALVDYNVECAALLVRMIQDVLVQRECVAEYPADWWQALKERFAPTWFVRRYPVLKRRIDMQVLYPRIAIPHKQHTVRLYHLSPADWLSSYTNE